VAGYQWSVISRVKAGAAFPIRSKRDFTENWQLTTENWLS
jgi:hypothetical protein